MGNCEEVGKPSRPHVHLNAMIPGEAQPTECGCQRQRQVCESQTGQNEGRPQVSITEPISTDTIPNSDQSDEVFFFSGEISVGLRASLEGPEDGVGDSQFVMLYARQPGVGHRHLHYVSRVLPSTEPSPHRPFYLLTHSLLI
jgi:hypothetical protein